MLLRLVIAALSVCLVGTVVFIEPQLIDLGVFSLRSQLWEYGYDLLDPYGLDSGICDGLATVILYTLPETIGVLVLYTLGLRIGRAGAGPSAHTRRTADSGCARSGRTSINIRYLERVQAGSLVGWASRPSSGRRPETSVGSKLVLYPRPSV